MTSSFGPLSKTTTTANCSSSSLLVVTLTQHLAPHSPSPLLTTSTPLPSLFTLNIFMSLHSEHLINFWLRIALASASAPPQGASTRPRVPYCPPKHDGLSTLLVLLLIAFHGPLLTTSSPLPSPLLLVISSNPLSLSPSWPAINFYLISRITSAHLTSNSMLCDNTLLCPGTLFSSPMGS